MGMNRQEDRDGVGRAKMEDGKGRGGGIYRNGWKEK